MTFADSVIEALRRAGQYNRNDQVAPAAVLWPDKDRLWAPLIPRLRQRLPLLTLGDYDVAARSGPSYWLRCAIAGTVPIEMPAGVPIIWLPGVSRADIRAVEECPTLLQPLLELQYRGVLWTQRNSKDWTPFAFLVSNDALGIEVTADEATRTMLGHALQLLGSEPVERLRREAPLRAAFFQELLNPDPPRTVLRWLNDPAGHRAACSDDIWSAFRALCTRQYRFDPDDDGPIAAAALLGKRGGHWAVVWERFAEAPSAWTNVPAQLHAARPQKPVAMFDDSVEETWPQDNDEAERRLRAELKTLDNATASQARQGITELEAKHGARRDWVWATLGQSPLAMALAHLQRLAEAAEKSLAGATLHALAEAWTTSGWQADDAALRALAAVEHAEDVAAVAAAVVAVYRPWLEQAALSFQERLRAHPEEWQRAEPISAAEGTCLLFSDALRFDAAQRLLTPLQQRGFDVSLDWRLTPLPGVTPTAKPAISPVADRLTGATGFYTTLNAGGSPLTAEGLRKLLEDAGYQILNDGGPGNPFGRGWVELGEIDRYGHGHQIRLARHLEGELRNIVDRVAALLDAGWQQVTIITDHGWLLLPGGLPKVDLPQHFTEPRKGRCARIKSFEPVEQQTVPWHWDEQVRIATPPGIGCYEAGKEYEHGGLSPQECVVPIVTVRRSTTTATQPLSIKDVKWRQLRCSVEVEGNAAGLTVDIRSKPGDAASSVVMEPKSLDDEGRATLYARDDHEGETATVVIVTADGIVRAQTYTTVGS